MGIVRGSHFYLHLITQKRPEYIVGVAPNLLDEDKTIFHSYELLGNQILKEILYINYGEDKTVFHSYEQIGNQTLKSIFHNYTVENKTVFHSYDLLGNQVLKYIFHEYNSEDKTIFHSYEMIGNQTLTFAGLSGQNDLSKEGNLDNDKYVHSEVFIGDEMILKEN